MHSTQSDNTQNPGLWFPMFITESNAMSVASVQLWAKKIPLDAWSCLPEWACTFLGSRGCLLPVPYQCSEIWYRREKFPWESACVSRPHTRFRTAVYHPGMRAGSSSACLQCASVVVSTSIWSGWFVNTDIIWCDNRHFQDLPAGYSCHVMSSTRQPGCAQAQT